MAVNEGNIEHESRLFKVYYNKEEHEECFTKIKHNVVEENDKVKMDRKVYRRRRRNETNIWM